MTLNGAHHGLDPGVVGATVHDHADLSNGRTAIELPDTFLDFAVRQLTLLGTAGCL